MKKSLLALTVLFMLNASRCAPSFAATPAHGSKVQVPPLISKGLVDTDQSTATLDLPTQAGKVSKIVTTNLLAAGPSWIAKGDKYYSLCAPNRQMVACAPIVGTSIMQDIEVGALAGPKGEPLLTFKIAPNTSQTTAHIAYAISYFMARADRKVAHFNRKAVSYARMPVATSGRLGPALNLIAAGGGGGCSYDDEGSYDCSGGDVGGDTGDVGSGDCQGNCQYPAGNDNGDTDPCVDANGNSTCPVVVIPGERPGSEELVSLPTCNPIGPFIIQCQSTPPFGSEPQELPKGSTPWLPQSMCDFASFFCSGGQVPNDPPPLTDADRRKLELKRCIDKANAMATYCHSERERSGEGSFRLCIHDAIKYYEGCDLIYQSAN